MKRKVNKSEKIRALVKQGLSPAKIAAKVGVDISYVYQISWKMKNPKTAADALAAASLVETPEINGHIPEGPQTATPASPGLDEAITRLIDKMDVLNKAKAIVSNLN